jgi:repressor LexA
MAVKLTARQQQILDLVRSEIARTGFPPTRAEIARALGFKSANAAEDHLRALARKGAIELTANASRGIRLKDTGVPASAATGLATGSASLSASLSSSAAGVAATLADGLAQLLLPIVGRVAAGSPILATEHIEREIGVEPALFDQTPDYLLRVRGLSMRDAGILDGDLLAVRKTPEARSGQIVVARIGDDVTVKRLSRNGKRIELLPENPDFKPIVVGPEDDFSLEGIAVGLIRTTALN